MGDGDPFNHTQHGALATKDAASVTQLLHLAASLCYDMFEAQVMCEQIRRRLDAIAVALRDAPASSATNSEATQAFDAVYARFASIVAQFHAFLARSASQDTVCRIVSSRVVVQQCRRFHENVDALLTQDAPPSSRAPVLADEAQHEVHSWTNRFENARENLQIALTKLSRDRMAMMRDLLDRAAQEDALTRIMYEYKRPDSGCSPAERQVIQHAFNTITRMSRAKAPLVPAWFLALYDIDALEREPRGVTDVLDRDNSAVVSVRRGTYLGAAVLVTFLQLNPAQLAEFVRTVTIWCSMPPSPHVVRIVGASHVCEPFVVVEDVRSVGSLAAFVATDPQRLWPTLYGAALGLQALHDQSIVHSALTPNHLIVTEDGTAMIADNVVSALCTKSASGEDATALRRKAPELLRFDSSKVVTSAVDVYAFGLCILDAMASSKTDPTTLATTADATATATVAMAKPASVTSEQWELVQRMCAEDPEQRPEMNEVVAALATFAAREAAEEEMKGSADAGESTSHEAQEEDAGVAADVDEKEPMAASASMAMATPSAPTAADAKKRAREEKKRAKEAKKAAKNEEKAAKKAAENEAKHAHKVSRQDGDKSHCIVM